jgi:holo-[acyl-carrier protein] synthase
MAAESVGKVIFGIGTDIIEVERIEQQIHKESGLKQRLFTPQEISYCDSKKNPAQYFAARFAAKEAFMNALGTGWRDGLAFGEIEIVNDTLGKPQLVLHGKAAEMIAGRGVTRTMVSLSHVKQTAMAIVILEI